jgi:DNA repair protein RecN (Recombination protein N)
MLELLRIHNLALIEDMELEFAAGMNVLTGETGAGKTFILKALSFLLGEKLPAQMVRGGAEKAEISAIFVLHGQELVIRRELFAETGRSRLYVNDVLRSQDAVKSLRPELMLHTSQHGQQKLLQVAFQDALVNTAMNRPDLLEQKAALIKNLQENAAARKLLAEKYQSLIEKRDLLEMQQQEIDAVAPEEGEEEKLEAIRAQARQQGNLREQYEKALLFLHGDNGDGLLQMLGEFEQLMRAMQRDDDSLVEEASAVSALRQNLQHLSGRLRRPPARALDVDIEEIEERLFTLAQLKRKMHRSLEEILSLRETIAENLSFLDSCALDIKQFDKKEQTLRAELHSLLATLLPCKRAAGAELAQRLEGALRELGFSADVHVHIGFMPSPAWNDIMDEKAHILWAPNPGQPPQPLDHIASGGELSRFLLALASVQPIAEDATLIFDEVDAGVGGLTLNAVAEQLAQLAKSRQMLLITHWPQLAIKAKKHFQVQKRVLEQETFTFCHALDKEQRRAELERMAGGGAQGKALAQSLLQ